MAETLGIPYEVAKDFKEGNIMILPKDKYERIMPKDVKGDDDK